MYVWKLKLDVINIPSFKFPSPTIIQPYFLYVWPLDFGDKLACYVWQWRRGQVTVELAHDGIQMQKH